MTTIDNLANIIVAAPPMQLKFKTTYQFGSGDFYDVYKLYGYIFKYYRKSFGCDRYILNGVDISSADGCILRNAFRILLQYQKDIKAEAVYQGFFQTLKRKLNL